MKRSGRQTPERLLKRSLIGKLLLIVILPLMSVACGPSIDRDQALQEQVAAAVASASDLTAEGLVFSVEDGVVQVSGSLRCEECPGLQTPAGAGSIQQSLGAVIRAVPGVTGVDFQLQESR
ncbi:MAG: hypothetical protein R3F41_07265 [Gammaproteobacteria bacterium]|nr:hypothetical protein [Pseudomonadales bacterium]